MLTRHVNLVKHAGVCVYTLCSMCRWFGWVSVIDCFVIFIIHTCSRRSTLLDIDGGLDYVTMMEDEKVISADEAICGRLAVLRGDPQLTAILKDRNLQGYKWKIAGRNPQKSASIKCTIRIDDSADFSNFLPAAIRQLHDSVAPPNPRAQGGLSLSSRPPRNRLSGLFGSMGGGGSEEGAGGKGKV